MNTETETRDVHRRGRWAMWTGRMLSAVTVLMLLFSAALKFMRPPNVVDSFVHQFGYPESMLLILGVLEVTCAALFVIPRTAFLGAILVTGYLGGAIATHARIGDPAFVNPLILGIFTWAGLYLRDTRLGQLMPVRKP